jgi:Skp family chaperone for outer membrane proteins
MKILLLPAALAASLIAPAAASAQAIPPATIAVVDLDKVSSTCNACRTAQATLQGQVNALKARETALATPLQSEGKSIQAALDALPKDQEPGAALQARIKAFQTKQQAGAQELQRQQQQIQRNQAYISQQISAKLGPIYQQVMTRRGANVMVEIGTTLASGATLDVTNDVLAALNAVLPSVQTTAPAQAAPNR